MGTSHDKSPGQVIKAEGGSTIQNVIQAVIHLPSWAWISGAIVFSLCICLAVLTSSVIAYSKDLRQFLPTPLAFIPATGEQSLIIVADFDNRSEGKYTGIDPAQYIYEQLIERIKEDNLNLSVERLSQPVDDNTVRSVGETYNATLVVWGWFDSLTITPRLTRVRELKGIVSDQENLRLSLADPSKVEFSVITDLPSQTNYLILFTLGIDKFSNSQYDEAMHYFDNALQVVSVDTNVATNPNETYFYRGYIYESYKNFEAAVNDYDMAIGLNHKFVDAYNNRGNIYLLTGKYQLAMEDYSKAIELNPNYAIPYANRGTLLEQYNVDYRNALADFDRAIELDPDFISAHLGQAYAYLGMADYEAATAAFNRVLELSTENDHLIRAMALSGTGDYGNSILESTKAIELNPNDTYALIVRGSVYADTRQYAPAIDDFKKAIELSPDNPFFGYFNLGRVYSEKGDFDGAIQAYGEAIKFNPYYPDAYVNLGYAFTGKGDFMTAIDNYEKAISLLPDHAIFAYNNAGFLSMLTLNLEKAISYLEKAKSISSNPLILLNLGDAYMLSGDLQQALTYQQEALQILETKGIEKERMIIGVWLYNYLPLETNDLSTIQNHVRVPDLEGKKAFVHYDLSYSYALLRDFTSADSEFMAARQLDSDSNYADYFTYKIRSIENLVNMDEDAKQWFEIHRRILEGN